MEIDDEDDMSPEEEAAEEAIENCGIGPDGYCSLAGSEYCDFVCPYRDGGHPCED